MDQCYRTYLRERTISSQNLVKLRFGQKHDDNKLIAALNCDFLEYFCSVNLDFKKFKTLNH